MNALNQKRIAKQIQKFEKNKPQDLSIKTTEQPNKLIATIKGPKQTFWADNLYELQVVFGPQYPHKPPNITFITEIFHPNVYTDGRICLDLLSNEWSPILDLEAVLTSIRSLLCDPNPESPANGLAAELYISNRQKFEEVNKKGKDAIKKYVEEEYVSYDYDDDQVMYLD